MCKLLDYEIELQQIDKDLAELEDSTASANLEAQPQTLLIGCIIGHRLAVISRNLCNRSLSRRDAICQGEQMGRLKSNYFTDQYFQLVRSAPGGAVL
jgi:hypothetical protein